MRIFVVNLAKNVDRLQLIHARLRELSLAYERIDAVYGKTVPVEEKRRNSSRFWWWCIKGYPMRDGEYGCAMSHLNIYRRMVEENIQVACVLEDDAKPRECLPDLLRKLGDAIRADRAQVALISNHRDEESGGTFRLRSVASGAFTDGYVITLPAARRILEKNFPVRCPSDTWPLWRKKGWIELYQSYPEGVNQEWDTTEGYVSDVAAVGDVVVDVRKMSKVGKVLWRLKRILGLTVVQFFLR